MARMELLKRDSRSIAYHTVAQANLLLKWLKDTFEAINNGRHPDFTLPKRIEVVVKDALLEHEVLQSVIDTKGIDNQETVARATWKIISVILIPLQFCVLASPMHQQEILINC